VDDHQPTYLTNWGKKKLGGVRHNVALPFTLKSMLRQKKKNYENSNISPYKNKYFNLQKIL
jgi:hypothetical protein